MNGTPEDDLLELYEITVKAARRCCYDLAHCVQHVPKSMRDFYIERQRMWETMFESATGRKDYRHKLHHEISDLESEIRRISEIAIKHGATQEEIEGPPL